MATFFELDVDTWSPDLVSALVDPTVGLPIDDFSANHPVTVFIRGHLWHSGLSARRGDVIVLRYTDPDQDDDNGNPLRRRFHLFVVTVDPLSLTIPLPDAWSIDLGDEGDVVPFVCPGDFPPDYWLPTFSKFTLNVGFDRELTVNDLYIVNPDPRSYSQDRYLVLPVMLSDEVWYYVSRRPESNGSLLDESEGDLLIARLRPNPDDEFPIQGDCQPRREAMMALRSAGIPSNRAVQIEQVPRPTPI